MSTADFEHDLAYEQLSSGAQTHKAEQQAEQQAVAQHISNTQLLVRCYERGEGSVSQIGAALGELGIELSPILEVPMLRRTEPKATLRRAFGVGRERFVVMTIVEAWAAAYAGLAFYTHDGRRISSSGDAAPEQILLGRYLCDDALSLDDEVRLVRHLHTRYSALADKLTEVAACMLDSGFLAKRTFVLEELRATSIATISRDVGRSVAKAIERALGPFPRLQSALTPAASFGQRRPRRYV